MQEKIPCTIGILTFNSAENLRRTLESVSLCAEILVADGGSTDATLDIAREYGCSIIEQSNPGNPIVDFSIERNRLLEAASYDLFFYLDSDEFASKEFIDRLRTITKESAEPTVFQVRYLKTDPSGERVYRTYTEQYQPRLFHRKTGALFHRSVHERISYETNTPVVVVEEPWYVPTDIYDFQTYKRKVDYRIALQAKSFQSRNPFLLLKFAVIAPVIGVLKSLVRIPLVRVRHGKNAIPPSYEFQIMYSQLVHAWMYTRQYIRNIRGLQ